MAGGTSQASQPFSLLLALYGDAEMLEVFSEGTTVQRWLDVERALAEVQAELGLISPEQASAVGAVCNAEGLDIASLWAESRVVGYPILPLVRAMTARMRDEATFAHLGATTQDIMDTGLVLQLRDAGQLLASRLADVGARLADLVSEHAATVMVARTHGQQAVPTTFGAKLAVPLAEASRDYARLSEVRARLEVISLFGAGGTSAAFGPRSREVRHGLAARLGLRAVDVPWHVSRERLVEFGQLCVLLSGLAGRLAREVIDLSRTEVAEVREAWSHHRGASSTMPQKANPISSEAVIGMSEAVNGLAAALPQAMRAGHERAAGEWHLEWEVVPRLSVLTASALGTLAEALDGLEVDAGRMRENLTRGEGLAMAEAYMIGMAPELGRERAHDIVYDAAVRSRQTGRALVDVLNEHSALAGRDGPVPVITPEQYTGECEEICRAALSSWAQALHDATG